MSSARYSLLFADPKFLGDSLRACNALTPNLTLFAAVSKLAAPEAAYNLNFKPAQTKKVAKTKGT